MVGILQKNWRDYVVTFPSKEEVQSQGKNAQKILVTPWDHRVPKIRISTQQAEALQVAGVVPLLLSLPAFALYQETPLMPLHKKGCIIDGIWHFEVLFFTNSKYIEPSVT